MMRTVMLQGGLPVPAGVRRDYWRAEDGGLRDYQPFIIYVDERTVLDHARMMWRAGAVRLMLCHAPSDVESYIWQYEEPTR